MCTPINGLSGKLDKIANIQFVYNLKDIDYYLNYDYNGYSTYYPFIYIQLH